MISEDGKVRVTVINNGGHAQMKIEDLGGSAIGKPRWYHRVTVRSVQEVARHVDLSTLKEVNE